jgi:hypothetical protein
LVKKSSQQFLLSKVWQFVKSKNLKKNLYKKKKNFRFSVVSKNGVVRKMPFAKSPSKTFGKIEFLSNVF